MQKYSKTFGRLGNQMFQGAYILAQFGRKEIPDIYLQDEKHFKDFERAIKILYGFGIYANKRDYVSIHVRRTDYAGNSFYVDLMNTDYYQKAMDMFPNEKFMVFSDDIEWCKKQDIFKDCLFSEKKDEVQDMNEMAMAKHNIIANSSYSWWAAYLNPNENKKVIAPSIKNLWYTDKIIRTNVPKEWIQIEC